jgi:hypothetical protein
VKPSTLLATAPNDGADGDDNEDPDDDEPGTTITLDPRDRK